MVMVIDHDDVLDDGGHSDIGGRECMESLSATALYNVWKVWAGAATGSFLQAVLPPHHRHQ